MKKWMIFRRESDGTHFLWNGEGCVRISMIYGWVQTESIPCWHHEYDKIPVAEKNLLNDTMGSRARGFTILQHGRYQVIARGEFKE